MADSTAPTPADNAVPAEDASTAGKAPAPKASKAKAKDSGDAVADKAAELASGEVKKVEESPNEEDTSLGSFKNPEEYKAANYVGAPRITVETTGDFMLMDPVTLDTIAASGTTEVIKTPFVETCLADGRLKEA